MEVSDRSRLNHPRGLLPFSVILLSAFLTTLTSCSVINDFEDPPLVGRWVAGNDFLRAEVDGRGESRISYTIGDDETEFFSSYVLRWQQVAADQFEIDLSCNGTDDPGGCDDDFYECTVDGRELRCQTQLFGVILWLR